MSNLSIRAKLVLWGTGTIFVLALAMVAVGLWKGDAFIGKARVVAEKLVDADLEHITEGVYNLVKAHDKSALHRVNNIDSLRKAITRVKIGKTGYVFVLGGKGVNRGRYIISRMGERDGENIWNERDANGNLIVQSVIKKALSLKPMEFYTERYLWRNPGESRPRWKIAKLAYYGPWDWVIGASVYEDELQDSLFVLNKAYWELVYGLILAVLLMAWLCGILTWFYARRLTAP
ncbi:MAG: Cache 3/Cache 2 fusion domain-containing protein, partial [Nitrospirae bacterium]|nr:Cache 3/Cache 2 fusion domain-containing protein [Nitrospirota bacterium]